jgi:hypothetical protein
MKNNVTRKPSRFWVSFSATILLLALSLAITPILLGSSQSSWGPDSQSSQTESGQTVPVPTTLPDTPTPTSTPTNTPTPTSTPVPTVIPAAQITPVADSSIVSVTVVQPDQPATATSSAAANVSVTVAVPANTFGETSQIVIQDVSVDALPAAVPASVSAVVSAFSINVHTSAGEKLTRPALGECITIRSPYSSTDLEAAGGRHSSLKLMRYDSTASRWIILNTTANFINSTLTAQVCSSLSVFGIGIVPPDATPTPEAVVVEVGGSSPSSLLLILLMAGSTILIGSGAYYMKQGTRS